MTLGNGMRLSYWGIFMLLVLVSGSCLALQAKDFNLDEEGDVVVIDHRKGARMHLDYAGPQLNKPVTVAVRAENEALKVTPRKCLYTQKVTTCELTLRYADKNHPVYGVQTIDIGRDEPQANPAEVRYEVSAKSADAPVDIEWLMFQTPFLEVHIEFDQHGPIIVQNGTNSDRLYSVDGLLNGDDSSDPPNAYPFTLPSKGICYIDENLLKDGKYGRFKRVAFMASFNPIIQKYHGSIVSDITDPNNPIYNGPYSTGTGRLSTCSAKGEDYCSSNKWASWTVGMFNLSNLNLNNPDTNNLFISGTELIFNNKSWNSGDTLYYGGNSWEPLNIALVLIQGSTNGAGFDAEALRLNQTQVASAPPCSSFVQK